MSQASKRKALRAARLALEAGDPLPPIIQRKIADGEGAHEFACGTGWQADWVLDAMPEVATFETPSGAVGLTREGYRHSAERLEWRGHEWVRFPTDPLEERWRASQAATS